MRAFTILLYHKNIVQVKSKIRQLEELEIAEIWSKTLLFLQYVETESVPNNARADAEHQNLLHRPYAPRLYGTYKKGLNIFSRLSSKCELIFDLVFFSVHKK